MCIAINIYCNAKILVPHYYCCGVKLLAGVAAIRRRAMEDRTYLLSEAERYFRLARAKSDRALAASLEAMAQSFLARAEAADAQSGKPSGEGGSYSPFVVGLNLKTGGSILDRLCHRGKH
jgi:hypothetical protein